MQTKRILGIIAVMMLVIGAIAYSHATTNTTNNGSMTPAEKTQIEQVVHNYLVQNPDVVIESLQAYQQRQMDQARKTIQKTQEVAPKFVEPLFKQTDDPMAGNPKGAITLVEFFDYQCPHCVDMTAVLDDVIKSNPNLRVIFKELPIKGAMSELASKAALAARNQGKYFEMHKAIMQTKERITEEELLKIAKKLGLNTETLEKDMKSDVIDQKIKTNIKLAQGLGLMGTPAIFIAKTDLPSNPPVTAILFVPGQVEKPQLQKNIDKISHS